MSDAAVIHIVDDDESIRKAVSALLRSVGLASCTYGSCAEFLDAALPDAPGCLLLDVRLPGTSGLDFQSRLTAEKFELPVIMMTGHGDVPMSVRAMKAGAVDFLTKPFRDQDLLDAVAVAIERSEVQRSAIGETRAVVARYNNLTQRERQVMALITQGRLNKQAAYDLGLSEITVKLHRASAMRKMAARTLPDLVKMEAILKKAGIVAPVTLPES